jgi:hypothetical protein
MAIRTAIMMDSEMGYGTATGTPKAKPRATAKDSEMLISTAIMKG